MPVRARARTCLRRALGTRLVRLHQQTGRQSGTARAGCVCVCVRACVCFAIGLPVCSCPGLACSHVAFFARSSSRGGGGGWDAGDGGGASGGMSEASAAVFQRMERVVTETCARRAIDVVSAMLLFAVVALDVSEAERCAPAAAAAVAAAAATAACMHARGAPVAPPPQPPRCVFISLCQRVTGELCCGVHGRGARRVLATAGDRL